MIWKISNTDLQVIFNILLINFIIFIFLGACHVTNNFITTFTEEKITRNVKDGDSILGMIDCETGMNGFAYSRIKNKLKMTAWTQGYKIVVEPHGNTLKVTVNDELIDNKNLFKIDELQ